MLLCVDFYLIQGCVFWLQFFVEAGVTGAGRRAAKILRVKQKYGHRDLTQPATCGVGNVLDAVRSMTG